jgi:hypothetical protein
MPLDVMTEAVIARPRAEVAAYACDPDAVTTWYANIDAVEWRTPPPLAVGTRLAFVARFLGRRLEYVCGTAYAEASGGNSAVEADIAIVQVATLHS